MGMAWRAWIVVGLALVVGCTGGGIDRSDAVPLREALEVRPVADGDRYVDAIAANTVTRFENGGDALNETLAKIKLAFEEGGLIFIPENGGGDGVRFRDRRQKPERSSS